MNEHKDRWMEEIKSLKTCILAQVQSQMGSLKDVDAQEFGLVVDALKDCFEMCKLEQEAKYYKTITDAMEDESNVEDRRNGRRNYSEKYMYMPWAYQDYPYDPDEIYRDMDLGDGRMYYTERGRRANGQFARGNNFGSRSRNYGEQDWGHEQMREREMPIEMRDKREGKSGPQRKHYMESKEMHKDKAAQLNELEKYMQELSTDIYEMIEDASPEEKQYMEKKIQTLASKIGNA